MVCAKISSIKLCDNSLKKASKRVLMLESRKPFMLGPQLCRGSSGSNDAGILIVHFLGFSYSSFLDVMGSQMQ